MARVLVRQIPIGPFQVFTYVVSCARTGDAAIIDPAGDGERLQELAKRERLNVRYILNTHGHADHVLANAQLKVLVGCPVGMHEADDAFFSQEAVREASLRELGFPAPERADMRLRDGDVLKLGDARVEVIHTPGHTPGSVCFLVEGNLFTGDTLFVGAAGRTDLTGGSLDDLLRSISERLIVLPDDTVIWPGHDYGQTPSSTIAREKAENVYITEFLVDDLG
jgi:glyoxylase-like metal-dependent hydrolase (beta-lactamase superfamily II)